MKIWMLSVLALLAIGLGCSKTSQQSQRVLPSSSSIQRSVTSGPTTAPDQTSNRTGTSSSQPSGSVLQRHDTVPSGVAAQTSVNEEGVSGGCANHADPSQFNMPTIVLDDPIGIGEVHDVCYLLFTSGQHVTVKLMGPDGTLRQTSTLCFHCNGGSLDTSIVATLPGDPIGTYRIVASQGTSEATASFTVEYPRHPLLRVAGNDGVKIVSKPLGSVITIAVAGFEGQQKVKLNLYYTAGSLGSGAAQASYIASVVVSLDQHGQARYSLMSQRADPAGCYVVDVVPAINYPSVGGNNVRLNGFCLHA